MSDSIYRQVAIDAFGLSEKTRKYGGDHSGYDTMMLYEIQDVLESLPSADATEMMEDGTLAVRVSGAKDVSRVLVMDTDSHVGGGLYYVDKDNKPTGKWVFDEDGYFRCEVCGKKPNDQSATTDYCPKCGARLGGDTE